MARSRAKGSKASSARAPRSVAITGALGFLGRRLIHQLERDDRVERVVALDARHPVELLHADGTAVHPKLSAHQIDLTEAGTERELVDIFEREGVEAVFHLAFLSNPTHHLESAHELETIGTMYVLHAAEAVKATRVVSLSSTMCYGAHPDNPAWLTEDSPLRGQKGSRFVADKIDSERQLERFAERNPNTRCAVARLGAMLGGSRTRNFWTRYFTRPVVPTVLGYDPLFQFLHADDAIRGLHALLFSEAEGAFNLVGRGVLPLSHVIDRLGRRAVPLPAGLAEGALRTLWRAQLFEMPPRFLDFLRWSWVADGHRLHQATGFAPQHEITAVLDDVRAEFAR